MSPLTITGTLTASLTWRTNAQSASPLYIWQRVRPWMVIICTPRSSAMRASSGAFRFSWFQPMRVLSVTGTFTALTVASISFAAKGRSRISADPASPLTTFLTGQPMLMSMIAWRTRQAALDARPVSTTALVVAAGSGSRMGGDIPKQFRLLGGKPVVRWAVESLIRHPAVQSVRVVLGRGQQDKAAAALQGLEVGSFIEGGTERADSVRAGLHVIEGEAVLVQHAARPFCPGAVVDRLLASLEFFAGSAPVLPVGDTLARVGDKLFEAVARTRLARVETPQAFRL